MTDREMQDILKLASSEIKSAEIHGECAASMSRLTAERDEYKAEAEISLAFYQDEQKQLTAMRADRDDWERLANMCNGQIRELEAELEARRKDRDKAPHGPNCAVFECESCSMTKGLHVPICDQFFCSQDCDNDGFFVPKPCDCWKSVLSTPVHKSRDGKKLVVVMNQGPKMSRGKYAAQAIHAALVALGIHPGTPVVVIGGKASDIETMPFQIRDAGVTELEPGTLTVGAAWMAEGERFETKSGEV